MENTQHTHSHQKTHPEPKPSTHFNGLNHFLFLAPSLFTPSLFIPFYEFLPFLTRHSFIAVNSQCFVDLFKQIFSFLSHQIVFVLWLFVFHRFTVNMFIYVLGQSFLSIHLIFIRMYFFNHILVVGNKKFIFTKKYLHVENGQIRRTEQNRTEKN